MPKLISSTIIALAIVLTASTRAPAQTNSVASDADSVYEQQSLDAIVVTADRIETSYGRIAQSVAVVTGSEIRRKQQHSVSDVLRAIPGIDVTQSGGYGRSSSVFMRGTNSDHTLVLIDGIEVNDPISPARTADLATLTTDNIGRVEVIRGPSSTVYGSDAMGGVINIISRRVSGPPAFSLTSEGGSLGTRRFLGNLSGGGWRHLYSVGLSSLAMDGISAANDGNNPERDGYNNHSFSAKIGYDPIGPVSFSMAVRYLNAQSDIDNGGGVGQDDPNNRQDTHQLFLRPQATLFLWNRRWRQAIGYSHSDHHRATSNETDSAHPIDSSSSTFDGTVKQMDWQNNLVFGEAVTGFLGIETEQESGRSQFRSDGAFGPFANTFPDRAVRTTGYFTQTHIGFRETFYLTGGFRVDDHTSFGARATYRLAPVVSIATMGIRVKGTYGTGFKAPSLFQLYSPFGNIDLKPGTSSSWDVGLEKRGQKGKWVTGVTYFRNEFENLVDFDSGTFTYGNISSARTSGLEWTGNLEPIRGGRLNAGYTYTSTRDQSTGRALLRRPQHKWHVNATYSMGTRGYVNAGLSVIGKRIDTSFATFPATPVILSRYENLTLAGSYRVYGNLNLFSRIENMLNRSYEEVHGYGTAGITAYGGIRIGR